MHAGQEGANRHRRLALKFHQVYPENVKRVAVLGAQKLRELVQRGSGISKKLELWDHGCILP
jgi:hypothetical protein